MPSLKVSHESWALREPFTISRGTIAAQDVIVVEVQDGDHVGRGEASPSPRFGETVDVTLDTVRAVSAAMESGAGREDLPGIMAMGAARSAVDAALWDLEAKRTRRRVWEIAGLAPLRAHQTSFTLSLDEPAAMARAAQNADGFDLLKLKLGAPGDLDRVRAVRAAVRNRRLIVDANEGWTFDELRAYVKPLHDLGVELIEQPLPAGRDEALRDFISPIPLCADEACTDRASLARITDRYDVINVKLEKCGGLTEALALIRAAQTRGLKIMVGCRIGTSLNLAPALLAAEFATFADLDGPFLLATDREPGLALEHGRVQPYGPELWG